MTSCMTSWTHSPLQEKPDLTQTSAYEAKLAIAKKVAGFAEKGQIIGAGSGSTSLLALHELAKRDQEEGLDLTFIPTSREIEWACFQCHVKTTSLVQQRPQWCFDGADEVDKNGNLIKGRGGAMYREKLVMKACSTRYILVDDSKFVKELGENFATPIECDPEALHIVNDHLRELGACDIQVRLAKGKDGPVITEKGNLILDTKFDKITEQHEQRIAAIPGVLESGLFWRFDPKILSADN